MDNVKNDSYYISKIKDDLDFVIRHMAYETCETFAGNEILQDSMMFRLIQVSENARKLSDGYREQHARVPWTAISGLRNRLVHDYGHVDLTIVFDTLKNDIPDLVVKLESELGSSDCLPDEL